MIEISARKLLNRTPTELWDRINGDRIRVHYDDGYSVLSATETIISSYGWTFHKLYPSVPLLRENHVRQFYKRGVLMRDSHIQQLNASMWGVVNHMGFSDDRAIIDDLCKIMTQVNNTVYNDVVNNTGEYITGADAYDYINLMRNPSLLALKEEVLSGDLSPASIDAGFNAAEKMVMMGLYDPDGRLNPISWMAMHGLIKVTQLLQCVFMRGYVPDIDKTQIPHLITNCLLEGMVTVRDYATLSREGAIANSAKTSDLRTSAVEARYLLHGGQNRHDVYKGDCGSTEYMYYTVSEPVVDESGLTIKDSDLKALVGTWYMDTDNVLKIIDGSESRLYGTTIKRRSQITCKHPNPHHACSVCYGRLAEGIPPGINVGSDVSKSTTQQTLQNSLSMKHLLKSIGAIMTNRSAAFKIHLKQIGNALYLRKINGSKRIFITVSQEEAKQLQDVFTVTNVKQLTVARLTAVKSVTFEVLRAKKHLKNIVDVKEGTAPVHMSYDLLDYILKNRECIETLDKYTRIDVTGFASEHPLFIVPVMLADMRAAASEISKLYARAGDASNINEFDIPSTLASLVEKINTSKTVNIAAIETILSGFISKVGTFQLAKGLENTYHSRSADTIYARSLSTVLIHNNQSRAFTSPKSYMLTSRTDAILDVIVDPKGITEHLKKIVFAKP